MLGGARSINVWSGVMSVGVAVSTMGHAGRRRGVAVRRARWRTAENVRLSLTVLLKCLHGGGMSLDEGILDGFHDVGGEDRLGIHRARHRSFPRLQHLLHLAPDRVLYPGISLHEGREQLGRHIECVRCADILDYGI